MREGKHIVYMLLMHPISLGAFFYEQVYPKIINFGGKLKMEEQKKEPIVAKKIFKRDNVSSKTKALTKTAMLLIIAVVLQTIEFPLPLFPDFLKIDLSDIPAILGTFALGPFAGVAIELLKNVLRFVFGLSQSAGVGEFANFIIGISLILPAGIIYKRKKTKKYAILGLGVGIVCMVIAGALMNYYVIMPFYIKAGFPLEQIIALAASVNPWVIDMKTLIIYAIIPFNIVKGLLVSIVTILIYKRISPILHR
jgi:riboflavin transporter FmnP